MPFRFTLFAIALMLTLSSMAQEMLVPMQYGPVQPTVKARKAPAMLTLPFFDDFSNYEGAPSSSLWVSQGAWVGSNYGYLPPSVGTLTLDAIDAEGNLYNKSNGTEPFPADTVMSLSLRLDSLLLPVARRLMPSDSVALSFYYQPGGGSGNAWQRSGDSPDAGDSLVLEFFDPTIGRWTHVWATDGIDLDSLRRKTGSNWDYVYIPIDTMLYLRRGFRFRFRNYCSFDNTFEHGMVGNCDQWHIDYVTIDYNRTRRYHYTRDVAFVNPAPSMLRKYRAMPARQFRASEMATRLDMTITNRYEEELSARYSFRDVDGFLRAYDGGLDNVPTFFPDGEYQTSDAHAHPVITSAYPDDGVQRVYHIVHTVTEGVGGDVHRQNDTVHLYQHLEDYYAYDDGTAENGYGIYNLSGNTRMAVRFALNVQDTLSAIDLCFNRTRGGENEGLLFYLCVWDDNDGHPGRIIYKDQDYRRPQFAGLNGFVRYKLEELLPVEGTIYIGIQQAAAGVINIGFDRNSDASQQMYYNVGGAWEQSFLAGAMMLRPYFGSQAVVGLARLAKQTDISVYPIPADNHIVISGGTPGSLHQLYDMQGRLVVSTTDSKMSTAALANGLYILKSFAGGQPVSCRKIVVSHR